MSKRRKKLKNSFKRFVRVIVLIILFIILCEIISKNLAEKKFELVEIHNNDYYTNSDFGINTIISDYDYDNDGIDDYTDIYLSALDYVKTKPKYKSKYYEYEKVIFIANSTAGRAHRCG